MGRAEFLERLNGLIDEARDSLGTDEVISEMELRIYALKEEQDEE